MQRVTARVPVTFSTFPLLRGLGIGQESDAKGSISTRHSSFVQPQAPVSVRSAKSILLFPTSSPELAHLYFEMTVEESRPRKTDLEGMSRREK